MVTHAPAGSSHEVPPAPNLSFTIEDAVPVEHAAVPTLNFRLRIDSTGPPVRTVSLKAQIRIAVTHRSYDDETRERLAELFGEGSDWAKNLKSLLWTHASPNVPSFSGSTIVDIPVVCTYDFQVVTAKYLHGLREGAVPLEFLFSGTIFYEGTDGTLRVGQISWDKEASYELPVDLWKTMMDRYFPNSAWLRIRTDVFDRLYAYKTRHASPTWEDAIESLLERAGEG
jgi:Family of unknown function (DUF6084)